MLGTEHTQGELGMFLLLKNSEAQEDSHVTNKYNVT